ncbi:MAG TPA: glycosyltransferase [Ktedonobacterales bacterium]|nr:glycosyltransferase [Ktedonobacterales bacterium]
MNPRVSVVVPTYHRDTLLERCLRALLAQDLSPSAYEIIIADDAASHQTARLVEDVARSVCRDGPRVRYVPICGAHGPAAARNQGWRAAHGDLIAFTDDDCAPAANWLSEGLAAARDPEVVGVSGRLLIPLTTTPSDYARNAALLQFAEFVTANCFYRRAAIEAVGGFDERFECAWREDSDLYFRLLRHGGRFARAERAIVTHPLRPARWGVSLRQQRKSMFNALLYKKDRALYRKHIQASPPWRYYETVGLLAGAGALTIGRRPRLARLALLGWALWTARFCAQRLRHTNHTPAHVAEMAVTSALIPPLALYWRLRGAVKYRVWFL